MAFWHFGILSIFLSLRVLGGEDLLHGQLHWQRATWKRHKRAHHAMIPGASTNNSLILLRLSITYQRLETFPKRPKFVPSLGNLANSVFLF